MITFNWQTKRVGNHYNTYLDGRLVHIAKTWKQAMYHKKKMQTEITKYAKNRRWNR